MTIRPSRSGIKRATAPEEVPIITCLSMSDDLMPRDSR